MGVRGESGPSLKATGKVFALGRCNRVGISDDEGDFVLISVKYDASPETFYNLLIPASDVETLIDQLRDSIECKADDPNQSSLDLGPYKPGKDKADHDCHVECNCIRLPIAGGFQ